MTIPPGTNMKRVILTSDPDAAELAVLHAPDYLECLKQHYLLPPLPKRAGAPYIAKITGTHLVYGLNRYFIPYTIDENGADYHFALFFPAIFEVQKHKNGQPVRGFVQLDEQGVMTRISAYEAFERAKSMEDAKGDRR